MAQAKPLLCAACGVAMNHHADKIDYNAAAEDPGAADPDLGGVVEQAHTCPACGQTVVQAGSTAS